MKRHVPDHDGLTPVERATYTDQIREQGCRICQRKGDLVGPRCEAGYLRPQHGRYCPGFKLEER